MMAEWGKGWLRARHDRIFLACFSSALLLWFLMSGWMLWKLIPEAKRSGLVIVHYTVYLGIDDVRSWPYVFQMAGVAFGIWLGNLLVAIRMSSRDELAGRAIAWMTFVMMVLWIVSQWYIVRVNV